MKYSKFKSLKNYLKPKNQCPSGAIIKFGQRGCGKSTDIAKAFYKFDKQCKKNKNIYDYFYTNVKINTDNQNYKYLDLNKYKFTDYISSRLSDTYVGYYTECDTPFKIQRNSIIYLDELALLYSNRSWKTFPQEFTKFNRLIRHFGIMLVMYSQSYDIDKSLRTSANELYLLTRILGFTLQRKIKKYIGITDKDDNGNADSQICDKVELSSILEKDAIKLTFIPFYTDLFNSFD